MGEDYRFQYPLGADSLILDAGAYYGNFTLWCRERWKCRAIGFEPATRWYNIAAERHKDDALVQMCHYGLGARTQAVRMVIRGDSTSAFLPLEGEVETVLWRDIAEVWEELKLDTVDLFKINIEGGEYELLPRLVETGLVSKVRFLQIQFHWYGGIAEPDAQQARIREALAKTHTEEWREGYPGTWTWESWARR